MAGWTEHIGKQRKMRPYEYFAKDHLGNVRVVFSPNGRSAMRVQEDHYYPFGMLMPYTHYASSSSTPNRLLYNSKELLNYLPGLRWYDYGARMYDAQVGRWTTIDPLAEKYYYETPYSYVGNNPIVYLDPVGMAKYKASIGVSWSTGIIGINLLSVVNLTLSLGGAKQEMKVYIEYDSDKRSLSAGVSYSQKSIQDGSGSVKVGSIKGGESNEKETKRDLNLKTGATKKEDKEYKKKDTGGLYKVSVEETSDGTEVKTDFGLSTEVNALILGVGAGIEFSIETSNQNTQSNKTTTDTQKNPTNTRNTAILRTNNN